MNPIQRKQIVSNLQNLAETTVLSDNFLSFLVQRHVLTDEDVNNIKSESGNEDQALKLYILLMAKNVAFDVFLEALRKTGQDVALNILSTNQTIKVDSIFCDEKIVIGTGSSGKVFQGTFGTRKVAVKKIPLSDNYNKIQEQITTMEKLDAHENIVRLFHSDLQGPFRRLALQYCQGSILDWIKGEPNVSSLVLSAKDILYQSTKGLAFLHEENLVHNNLKPTNILLYLEGNNGRVRVKIADFGFSKFLQINQTSRTFSLNSGSERWCAPEVLHFVDTNQAPMQNAAVTQRKIKSSRESDIFSLGCVYYTVLANGKHPFGDAEVNIRAIILAGTPTATENDLGVEFRNNGSLPLIEEMISLRKIDRPLACSILFHPIFWDESKALQFLINISDKTKKLDTTSNNCVSEINGKVHVSLYAPIFVSTEGWLSKICTDVKYYLQNNNFKRFGPLDGKNIMMLVRAVRNLNNHYKRLPKNVQNKLGTVPVNFLKYWTTKFPWLIYFIWLGFQKYKNNLISYYHNGTYEFHKY